MAKNGYRLVKRYNISDVEIQRTLTDTTPSNNPKSISDTDKFLFSTALFEFSDMSLASCLKISVSSLYVTS